MVVFTVLTGLVYPLAMTGLAQVLFPANHADRAAIRRPEILLGAALGHESVLL